MLQEFADGALSPSDHADRRAYPRHPYPHKQRIAYTNRTQRFEDLEFDFVEFFDISVEGFSFFIRGLPNGDYVVAELGHSSNFIYVEAEIRHVTPHTHRGALLMQIGCHYLRRLNGSAQANVQT